jgi:hypothetical protein
MVFGIPSKYSFVLRSSPIVCGCNAFYTAVLFLYNSVVLKNPKAAARRVAKGRFRDTLDDEEGSLHSLQRNTIFRVAVFLLGALPQVLKLCAVEGLLWTKIWGLMFLSAFLVLEFLVLLLGRGWRDLDSGEGGSHHEMLDEHIGISVVCASLSNSFYFIALAVFAIAERHIDEERWPYLLGSAILGVLYVVSISSSTHEAVMALATFVTIPLGMFASLSSGSFLPVSLGLNLLPDDMIYTIFIGASVFFALVIAIMSIHRLIKHVRPAYAKYSDFGLGAYFLLSNLVAALLYYWLKYDAHGTIKPAWTDRLG